MGPGLSQTVGTDPQLTSKVVMLTVAFPTADRATSSRISYKTFSCSPSVPILSGRAFRAGIVDKEPATVVTTLLRQSLSRQAD